ncbi:hypothetical protein M405DRAFT_817810, partial [Rhizopogon salebrosus TDB-379]
MLSFSSAVVPSNICHCTCSSQATRSAHTPHRARALPGKRGREMGRRCHQFHRISNRPGWACRHSTQRMPISWLRLTASSLPTSGEGEGSEPPGTRVARLKAPSLVLKSQHEETVFTVRPSLRSWTIYVWRSVRC